MTHSTRKPADLYVVELPVFLECGPQALKNIQIQASYPRGRHASEHLDLKPSSGFADNLQSRIINTATHSLVELVFDLLRPETTTVSVDIVAYKASDFTVASFDREAEGLPELSYVAEKVQVFASAENHRELEVSCWLVAVRADNIEELKQLSSWLVDILFQLDKTYVEVAEPGQLVPMPWYERRVVNLISLAFRTRTGKTLRDGLTDGPRHIGEAVVAPVVNSQLPRVIVGREPKSA